MKKDTYIKVNLTTKQKSNALKAADHMGLTLADFIRYQITKGIEREEKEVYFAELIKEAREEYKAGKTIPMNTPAEIKKQLKQLAKEAKKENLISWE